MRAGRLRWNQGQCTLDYSYIFHVAFVRPLFFSFRSRKRLFSVTVMDDDSGEICDTSTTDLDESACSYSHDNSTTADKCGLSSTGPTKDLQATSCQSQTGDKMGQVFTPLRGKVRPHRHETVAQQKRRIARFLRLTLPKTPLCAVFYNVFMLCEADPTPNSDVFELAVAQNNAIYSVVEPAVKKHRNLRRFQQHGRQRHCYLRGVFTFLRRELKPRQCTKTLQKINKQCKKIGPPR